MAIPRQVVEEIVARSNIEQIIGQYVPLKRSGVNAVGRCPFHNEKTPSFYVFNNTNSFYCFGCGAGGDVITFIMKAENLDYRDALEFLAQKAGITIPNDAREDAYRKQGPDKKRLYQMNKDAAKFFHRCLYDPKIGTEALKYLTEKRRLSQATIKHFYLGYAPNDFGMLLRHMKSLGYTEQEMITGFLCGKSEKNGKTYFYDYFRNRVIFPIVDVVGNIIAFGGRVMDDSKPKYLNSSDTPAFSKRRNLFALNYAKAHCADSLILCEGYLDVISLHAAGFENAVATLGTAITEDHARVMAKYTKKVIICYDADEAGQNAANKAMRILGEVGVDVRVLKIPGAKDPDEFLSKNEPAKFRNLIEGSRTGFEFKCEAIIAKYGDLSRDDIKLKASEELVAVISDYYSSVEREIYIARASELLGISKDVIRRDVERRQQKKLRELKNEQSREAKVSLLELGDRINPDASKNPRANMAEQTILGLMLSREEHRAAVADGKTTLCAEDFLSEFHRRAFSEIVRLQNEGGFSMALLAESFTPDEIGRLAGYDVARMKLSENGTKVLSDAIDVLKSEGRRTEGGETLEDELRRRRELLKKKKNT